MVQQLLFYKWTLAMLTMDWAGHSLGWIWATVFGNVHGWPLSGFPFAGW
jgi:hypothetical protein